MLTTFSERVALAKKELGTAALALEGNKENLEAISSLRGNLRSVRAKILSDFAGIVKIYDVH